MKKHPLKKKYLLNLQTFAEEATESTESVETTEEVTEESTETEQIEQTEEAQPFLNIKYNKEEKALSQEEAIELAQKGMNYDKVTGKLDEMKKYQDMVSKLAEKQGYSLEEYENQMEVWEQEKIKEDYINQGIPETMVDEFIEAKRLKDELNAQKTEQEQNDKIYADIEALETFVGKEIDVKQLPDEVLNAWLGNGIPLQYAYAYHNFKGIGEAKEQEIMERMSKKQEQSTGAPNTGNADNTSGGGFTAEQIASMSDADYKKNFMK